MAFDPDVFLASDPSSSSSFDPDAFLAKGEPPKPSGLLKRAGDYGISALKGAIAVPEAVVGLADIATGGHAGKLAEEIGFRPKEAKATLDEFLSPEQQAANAKVQDAKGFLPTIGASLQNPSTIAHTVVESVPSMLGGGVIAQGIRRTAPTIAPYIAGAVGEGIVGAGSAAEQVRQQTDDGLLGAKQIAPVVASGIGTALIGSAGGKLAQKFNLGDIDTMLANGASKEVAENTVKKGMLRRIAEGGISEGVFEEMPQSMQEQVWQNIALGKPTMEGVAESGATGLLTGGLMGAGANLRSRQSATTNTDEPLEAAPEAPPILGLPNRPNDTMFAFSDGSVGTQSQIDAHLSSLPESDRAHAMATLLYGAQAVEPTDTTPAAMPISAPKALPNYVHNTMYVFSDGSTGTQRDIDAHLNSLPEPQRISVLATMMKGAYVAPDEQVANLHAQAEPNSISAAANLAIATGATVKTGDENGASDAINRTKLGNGGASQAGDNPNGSAADGVLRHDARAASAGAGMPGISDANDGARSGFTNSSSRSIDPRLIPLSKRTQEQSNGTQATQAITPETQQQAPSTTAVAQPSFVKSVDGRVRVQGFTQAHIQSARDALKVKGVIVGNNGNAIFPKNTDIGALKRVLGVAGQPVVKAVKPTANQSQDLIGRIKQLGGISSEYLNDIISDPSFHIRTAFKKGGTSPDDMVSMLEQSGFMFDKSNDNPINQLQDAVRRYAGGHRAFKAHQVEAEAEQQAKSNEYDAKVEEARSLGIADPLKLSERDLEDAIWEARDAQEMAHLDALEAQNEEIDFDDVEQSSSADTAKWLGVDNGRENQTGDTGTANRNQDADNNVAQEAINQSQEPQGIHREVSPRTASPAENNTATTTARNSGAGEEFVLQGQTETDLAAQARAQAAQEAAQRDDKAKVKAEQSAKDQAALDAKIKARTDNADNFQFGESSEDAIKPVGDLFNPSASSKKPALIPLSKRFVKAPDGSIDFGEITADMATVMRRQGGKIRLENGKQNSDGSGYGLAHIESRHGKQIRTLGFNSIPDFVSDAVKHIESIWSPDKTSQLVVIQAREKGKAVFIQLKPSESGDFYSVNTAFPVADGYAEKKNWKVLWDRESVPTDASGASSFADPALNSGERVALTSSQSSEATLAQSSKESKIEDFGGTIAGNLDQDAALLSLPPRMNAGSGMELSAVRDISARISAKKVWNVELFTVASFDALPAQVQQKTIKGYGEQEAREAKGIAHNGKVYVIAANNESGADVEQTILHEVEGHIGIHRLYGKEINQKLNALYLAIGGRKGLKNLAKARGIEQDLAIYGWLLNDSDFTDEERIRVMMDEALAHYAQHHKFGDRVKAIVGMVRAWLREHGFAKLAEYGETDLLAILREGRAHLKTAGSGADATSLMVAWHGSPHDHNKFDSSKIGTGEGAQAYGHGLYFAGNKAVAEFYRKNLSDANIATGGEDGIRKIIKMLDESADRAEKSGDTKQAEQFRKSSAEERNKLGKLYQVELTPKEDEYLLWDKPLSDQSEKVKAALAVVKLPDSKMTGQEIYSYMKEVAAEKSGESGTSPSFYNSFSEAASKELHSLNIRGIKYLDGTSRSKPYEVVLSTSKGEYARNQFNTKLDAEAYAEEKRGEGFTAEVKDSDSANYNYVIFDDKDVSITAKYSKARANINNPHILSTLAAAIDKAMGGGFTKLLEATGRFKLITSEQITEYLGDGAKFSVMKFMPKGSVGMFSSVNNNRVNNFAPSGTGLVYLMEDGGLLIDGNHVYPGDVLYLNDDDRYVKDIPQSVKDEYANRMSGRIDMLVERSKSINRKVAKKSPANIDTNDISALLSGAVSEWELARYPNARPGWGSDIRDYEYVDAISEEHDPEAIRQKVIDEMLENKRLIVGGYLHTDAKVLSYQEKAAIARWHEMGGSVGKSVLDANSNTKDADNDIRYSKDGRILAFVVNGNTHLVADNISSTDDNVKGLLHHELGVHALQLARSTDEFQSIIKQFKVMGKMGGDKVKAAYASVPNDTPAHLVDEEAMGYFVEQNTKNSLSQRFINVIRTALRKIGKALPELQKMHWFKWADKLSDNDILYMAQEATKRAPELLAPAVEAFDNLFGEIKTKETEQGIALYQHSKADEVLQKEKWLSEAALAQVAEERLADFAHQPKVLIRNTVSDVLGDAARDNGAISGMVHKGSIYLFRDGIGSTAEATSTLWHELLHYGLRRFMTKEQYIPTMQRLYLQDAWIKQRADAWLKTSEANEAKKDSMAYARARGVDEALAELAETNAGKYQSNSLRSKTIRAVANWVAKLAEKLGFSEAAAKWRGVTNKEARELIESTFAKLHDDASGQFNAGEFSDPSFKSKSSPEQTIGDTGRGRTSEQLKAFRNVGRTVTPPTIKERIATHWQDAGKKLAQGLVDQFRPIRDLDANAYTLMRLSKGASGAFEVLLKGGRLRLIDGVYDFDPTKKGGVIERLLTPLQGEADDFMWWVAANRAEQLSKQDREHLFTKADIAAMKSLVDGDTPFNYRIQHGINRGKVTRKRAEVYADSLLTFNQFHKNTLDMAEQSGLIDPDSRKHWESEFYVPFYRVEEDDGGVRGMNIKSSVIRQQAFKQLKGGSGKLNSDLLDNALMNWAHLLDASAKNRAAQASLNAAEKMGIAEQVGEGTKKSVWYMGRVTRKIPEGQAYEDGGKVKVSDGTATVSYHGKVHYVVSDPLVMSALESLEYAGMRNPLMNAMGTLKHALTIGVTASPYFKIRNLIRDSIQSIAVSGLSKNAYKNLRSGSELVGGREALKTFGKASINAITLGAMKLDTSEKFTDSYFRLLAGGGTIHFGTMLEGSESKRVRALAEAGVDENTILDNESKWKAFYKRAIEPAVTAYNELGNRGEAVNRAALYDQLIKQGKSHAEASLLARDLMDFSMQGAWTSVRFLNQTVPFFNARLQGLYKLGRAASDDPKRMGVVLGATAMASIALMLAYSDDDDWKKREDWDRDGFWWFKFGGEALRIPKPFEIGAIASVAERGVELFTSDEMTGERFRERMWTLLRDNLSMNPVPQLVKPMLDVYSNKNSFTGRPIETMGMERLDPEYRFTQQTSMAARALSTATLGAQSPVQIDHLIRAYFGWLGAFVIGTADIVAKPLTGQVAGATPDYWRLATGGMIAGTDTASSRYVSKMYTQAKEIEQAYGTWKMLQKSNPIAAQEYREDHLDALKKYRSVEAVKKAESNLNTRIRMIERSSKSSDEKRELINLINRQKDQIARRLNVTHP